MSIRGGLKRSQLGCTSAATAPLDNHVGEHTIRSKSSDEDHFTLGIAEFVKLFHADWRRSTQQYEGLCHYLTTAE